MASSSAVRIRKQMRPRHQHFACNIRAALEELEVLRDRKPAREYRHDSYQRRRKRRPYLNVTRRLTDL
jgi:hypothetical protein